MGEPGIDCGGPVREYFRLLREETKQWFYGVDGCMLPICSAAAIQVSSTACTFHVGIHVCAMMTIRPRQMLAFF